MGKPRKAVALLLAALETAFPARAADPGPGWPPPDGLAEPWRPDGLPPGRVDRRIAGAPGHPPRRVTGGPDYVGSNFGLGKPAYSGIGPRPDWGRGTID